MGLIVSGERRIGGRVGGGRGGVDRSWGRGSIVLLVLPWLYVPVFRCLLWFVFDYLLRDAFYGERRFWDCIATVLVASGRNVKAAQSLSTRMACLVSAWAALVHLDRQVSIAA